MPAAHLICEISEHSEGGQHQWAVILVGWPRLSGRAGPAPGEGECEEKNPLNQKFRHT
ncbi:hypothetical protein GCM10009582_25620 [Arthrobacter flavus]